ncbi:uncharacterized protein lrrfip1b isoform X1 [Odontesthes bonariensis]|uniref:uncharacterized protein lrrfip1b isoform X1 n=1 Tax=Odontesthes bonariensis TaxID=219752 RepID=UPI003F58B465
MGTQGPGRRRIPNREKLTAEDDALNQIAREAEARLAAKRAARAEAREIRMKELEKQQKELFHSHKKYYGLDNKWGHIEQWMEDSERYSRLSRRHTSMSDDEERMSVGSRGSLKPSDYSSFLGSGSRASSRASSARASPVVEERTDREFLDKGSRTASTLSAATLASLGGASSRRGSCDTSFSVETEASIREIKDSLVEAEEKYRRAMVSNAQLHNDKTMLMYQVETQREELSDMEELLWEARRRCDDTNKEFERERQAHSVLQFHFKEVKETLRHSEELLTEVSDLRLKSSTYCQEIADLQEALQWKEKKIGALERQREISDIVRIERDRLRDDVVRLRDALKKHGVVVSPDLTTNGDTKVGVAEDDVGEGSASSLAQESHHGGRESMLGKTRPAEGRKRPQNDVRYSASNRTRQSRKRPNATEKSRTEPPRNRTDEKDPIHGGDENLQRKQSVKKPTTKKWDKTVTPVRKASTEKVLKSRLIPPRPANEIILDNKAIVLSLMAAGKLNCLPEAKQEPGGSGVLEKEAPSPGRSSGEGAPGLPAERKTSGFRTAGSSWKEKDSADERGPNTESEGGEGVIIKKAEPKGDGSTAEEDQRIHEPGRGDGQDVPRGSLEGPTTRAATPFGPEEMWTCLEGVVKGQLQVNNQGLVAEMSRIFSEILISLHQWTSDLENTLQNASIHQDGGGKESTTPEMDPRLQTDVEESTGSTSKVCSAVQNPPPKERDPEVDSEEPGADPAGAVEGSSSEEFAFIESYFAEPLRTPTTEPSPPSRMAQSCLVDPGKEPKELKRSQTVSSGSHVGQSSKVRRLIEETAEELKAMVVPELVLLRLQEGRPLAEPSRSNAGSLEEPSAADMDSCEEAGEEEVLQQAGDV